MRHIIGLAVLLGLVVTATSGNRVSAQGPNPAFNFDTGNSGIEVIIPTVIPALFQTTSPNDAPIVLRVTTVITNAWFDAIAPYHPTAMGVYSRLGRRPAAEAVTNRQKNIAMFYASYRALNSLLPNFADTWRAMMASVGLDPDNAGEDLSTPIGIGNAAGRMVVAVRERDGMNQLGDEGGKAYNRRPYEDYTGYEPANTAFRLWNPSRWQPLIGTPGNGTFAIQQFVTPQWARTRPYSYDSPERFRVAVPRDSNVLNFQAYRAQADEVMAIQAGLTDEQKMLAELFDNKIASLGFSALFITQSRGMSLDEFVHYDFLTNVAAFDGGIATWKEKYQVRRRAARVGDPVPVSESRRERLGRPGARHRGRPARPRVAVVSEYRQPSRVSFGFVVLLRRQCAGQPALPRVGHVWLVGERPGRVIGRRTRCHTGAGPDAWAVEHVHRVRSGLQPEPRDRWRPLRGRD